MESTHVSTVVALKNLSYILGFMAGLGYLGIDQTAVMAYAILLLVDLATGVLRAGIVEGRRAIKSYVAIRGFASKVLVFVVPFVLALTGKGVGFDLAPVASASITVFILSTSYSILGNIHSISTGKPKQEFDAIDYFIQRIRELLVRVIHEEI